MFIDDVAKKYPSVANPDAVIKIDNVIDYVFGYPKDYYSFVDDGICLVPPFSATWFECKIPKHRNIDGKVQDWPYVGHLGCALSSIDIKDIDMSISDFISDYFGKVYGSQFLSDEFYFNKLHSIISHSETRFIVNLGWFFAPNDVTVKYAGCYTLFLNGDGKVSSASIEEDGAMFRPASLDKEMFPPDHPAIDKATPSLGFSSVIIMALNFLHCKNVSLNENNIPMKLIKARKKRNRPFLQRYYTLEIESMRKVLNEAGAAETGIKHALHICRGHFKTYDGKGLFGKYKGTFWFPSHVRGDIATGIVEKDYNINP